MDCRMPSWALAVGCWLLDVHRSVGWLRGGAEFQKARRAGGRQLYCRSAFDHHRRHECRRRRGATFCRRTRHSGRVVDLVSLQAAQRFDRALAHQQSRPQGGAGGVDGGAGKCAGAERRFLSQCRRQFLREPAEDVRRTRAHPQRQRVLFQSLHAAGQRFLRAGCIRPEPPNRGILEGAGTAGALSAGRDAHHVERQRGGRGDSGGVVAGAD